MQSSLITRPLAAILRSESGPVTFARPPTPDDSSDPSSLQIPPPALLKLERSMFRHDPEYPYPPPSPRQPSFHADIILLPHIGPRLGFHGPIFRLIRVRNLYGSPIRVGSYLHLQCRSPLGQLEGCVEIKQVWERQTSTHHVFLAQEEESGILVLLLIEKEEENKPQQSLGSLIHYLGNLVFCI